VDRDTPVSRTPIELATITLKNDILKKINYEDMIEDFISRIPNG
jgi:hypothetical protein